jgi:hypothetical protein
MLQQLKQQQSDLAQQQQSIYEQARAAEMQRQQVTLLHLDCHSAHSRQGTSKKIGSTTAARRRTT